MEPTTSRLLRSRTDSMIAGVAGGIARYTAVDATIVRLGFVALALTGAGLLLYPLLWLLMPREGAAGPAPEQALDELRQQARRVGGEIREVFVAPGSASRRPRFDPMTGAPIDPESDIPINNINPGPPAGDTPPQRNQILGFALLALGIVLVLAAIPAIGPLVLKLALPALLIGAGVVLLRRSRS